MEYQRREKGLAFAVKVVSWVQGIFFYLGGLSLMFLSRLLPRLMSRFAVFEP